MANSKNSSKNPPISKTSKTELAIKTKQIIQETLVKESGRVNQEILALDKQLSDAQATIANTNKMLANRQQAKASHNTLAISFENNVNSELANKIAN